MTKKGAHFSAKTSGLAVSQLEPPRLVTDPAAQRVTFSVRRFHWPVTIMALLAILLAGTRLNTAVKIGADESYELSKAILLLKGFNFYTDVWNDQPLLHTAFVATALKYISPSVLRPRLITAGFSFLLIISLFSIVRRINGTFAATTATFLLLASPGFVDLSSSCMVEIPALAPAVAGIVILLALQRSRPTLASILAGVAFGIAFQIKLINVILLPLVGLVISLGIRDRTRSSAAAKKDATSRRLSSTELTTTLLQFSIFFTSLLSTFLLINFLLPGGSYLLQIKQTWLAHFSATRSFEYGSPADFPFQWSVLLKNWDQTIPALIGIVICLLRVRKNHWLALPVTWFALELIVFATHTPWWSYYYVHNAIPITWCAGIGIGALVNLIRARKSIPLIAGFSIFALAATTWMIGRIYLQITTIRNSPQTYNSLVLTEIERYKPFTEFLYTDDGVYSFHSGIPLPPKLGVVSLKRFWTGDMTNAKLTAELWKVEPGLILIENNTQELPYSDLLHSQYSLVYEDPRHRLYARRDVSKQVKW